MRARDNRWEENFDRRESLCRKGTVSYLLFRNDPKGTIAVFVILLGFMLVSILIRHHR
jgi:hypothetical protein